MPHLHELRAIVLYELIALYGKEAYMAQKPNASTQDFKDVIKTLGEHRDPKFIAFLKLVSDLLDSSVNPEEFVDVCENAVFILSSIDNDTEHKQLDSFRDQIVLLIDRVFPSRFTDRVVAIMAEKYLT